MNPDAQHIPVMLEEVVENLSPQSGGIYVDGTFGGGSYSQAILSAAQCHVVGIDRDPDAIKRGQGLVQKYQNRLSLIPGNFGDIKTLLEEQKIYQVDGLVLDIGVSSFQIDEAERGFSFQKNGPLDMRMSREGESAADVVNNMSQEDIAHILWKYGEEKKSRKIARAIVEDRKEKKFETTFELANLVRSVLKGGEKDPATRTFQALRIYVNKELEELERALEAAEEILRPGGTLVVVTFHSLEDRIVKNFLKTKSGGDANPSRHVPEIENKTSISFKLPSKKAIIVGADEAQKNPRSRSAKMRVAIKVGDIKAI